MLMLFADGHTFKSESKTLCQQSVFCWESRLGFPGHENEKISFHVLN